MLKPTFLKYEKPLLTAMIVCETPEEAIKKINDSIELGADALGIQLCCLKREYRSKETLLEIFKACRGLPIYITSYRGRFSEGMSDDECAELLLLGLDAGATLCDVIGDFFEKDAKYQLAQSEEAIKKQKSLIDEIHKRGGEVLMSSHTKTSCSLEESMMIAKAQAERGADVIKIVHISKNKNEIPMYIDTIKQITKEIDKKLLFLVSEEANVTRYLGPSYGVCMYLCLSEIGKYDTPDQPLLSVIKPFRETLTFH